MESTQKLSRHRICYCCCPANFRAFGGAAKSAAAAAASPRRSARISDGAEPTVRLTKGKVIVSQPGLSNGSNVRYVNGSAAHNSANDAAAPRQLAVDASRERDFDEIDLGEPTAPTPTDAASDATSDGGRPPKNAKRKAGGGAKSGEYAKVPTAPERGEAAAAPEAATSQRGASTTASSSQSSSGIGTSSSKKSQTPCESDESRQIAEEMADMMLNDGIHERFDSTELLQDIVEEDISNIDLNAVTEANVNELETNRPSVNKSETNAAPEPNSSRQHSQLSSSECETSEASQSLPEKPPRTNLHSQFNSPANAKEAKSDNSQVCTSKENEKSEQIAATVREILQRKHSSDTEETLSKSTEVDNSEVSEALAPKLCENEKIASEEILHKYGKPPLEVTATSRMYSGLGNDEESDEEDSERSNLFGSDDKQHTKTQVTHTAETAETAAPAAAKAAAAAAEKKGENADDDKKQKEKVATMQKKENNPIETQFDYEELENDASERKTPDPKSAIKL